MSIEFGYCLLSLNFSECIDHENIQKAIGFLVPPEAATNEIWILEESCLCNLEDVIQGTIQLDNIPWLQVGKNVVDGLFHLFCQGIPHHNIKPTNVLVRAVQIVYFPYVLIVGFLNL